MSYNVLYDGKRFQKGKGAGRESGKRGPGEMGERKRGGGEKEEKKKKENKFHHRMRQ